MQSKLTGFSRLIITFVIIFGLWLVFTKSCNQNENIVVKIQSDLENQGFTDIEVTGHCNFFACGSSGNDMYKTGYAFTAVSKATRRKVTGCACKDLLSQSINYHW